MTLRKKPQPMREMLLPIYNAVIAPCFSTKLQVGILPLELGDWPLDEITPHSISADSNELEFRAGGARPMRFGERGEAASMLQSLAERYSNLMARPDTRVRVDLGLTRYSGRPTPLWHAQRLTRNTNGARIYFKNELAAPSNSHLQIVVCGQVLLAQMMGYRRLVTATNEGQRGLLAASMAARVGLPITVYVNNSHVNRHRGRMQKIQLMGAEIKRIDVREATRGDIREAALDDCLTQPEDSYFVMGLDGGPPPYPSIIRDLVSVVGRETLRQLHGMAGCAAAAIVARGGQTSDAFGLFPPFLSDRETRLVFVDLPREGTATSGGEGTTDPFAIQLSERQEQLAQQIMEGLEYPGVSRELGALRLEDRIENVTCDLGAAESALLDTAQLEGIVMPIESAATVAWARALAKTLDPREAIIVSLAQRAEHALLDTGQFERLLSSLKEKAEAKSG